VNGTQALAARHVLYGAALLLVLFLQIAVFPLLLPVRPLWLVLFPVILAVFEGEWPAVWWGLACGVAADALIRPAEGFYSLLLVFLPYAAGVLTRRFFVRKFPAAMLFCAGASAAVSLLYCCFFYLLPGRAGVSALWLIAVPEALAGLLTAPLLYLLVWPAALVRPRGVRRRAKWKA
jgi:rod shape-determining protein MreD